MASGICYIQVVPVMDDYGNKKKVKGLKVSGLTQSAPQNPEPGARVIKLSLEIPDDQLLPLEIRALPDDLRMNEDMTVIATNLGK